MNLHLLVTLLKRYLNRSIRYFLSSVHIFSLASGFNDFYTYSKYSILFPLNVSFPTIWSKFSNKNQEKILERFISYESTFWKTTALLKLNPGSNGKSKVHPSRKNIIFFIAGMRFSSEAFSYFKTSRQPHIAILILRHPYIVYFIPYRVLLYHKRTEVRRSVRKWYESFQYRIHTDC